VGGPDVFGFRGAHPERWDGRNFRFTNYGVYQAASPLTPAPVHSMGDSWIGRQYRNGSACLHRYAGALCHQFRFLAENVGPIAAWAERGGLLPDGHFRTSRTAGIRGRRANAREAD